MIQASNQPTILTDLVLKLQLDLVLVGRKKEYHPLQQQYSIKVCSTANPNLYIFTGIQLLFSIFTSNTAALNYQAT